MSDEFFAAIKAGNKDEVEQHLKLDPGLINASENGLSPVLVAAYHQEPEIAGLLADHTVTLSIFEAAATGKTIHVIRLLAKQPELVNAYAEDGFQPLGLACFFGHFETAEYLIKAGALINSPSNNSLHAAPIQSAAAAGHLEIVRLLIQHGADPNVREQGGYTPLHAAAQNDDEEMIRTLLFGGADLNIKSKDDKTPLDLAMEAGHAKATLLLSEGITRRFRTMRDDPDNP